MDEADSASDEFDHNLALTQLAVEQDELREVTEALQRIQAGRYGVCEETGKAIPAERLRAIPWTRFTRAVEERLEKEGVVRPQRLHPAATVRSQGGIRLVPEMEEMEEEEEESNEDESSETASTQKDEATSAASPRSQRRRSPSAAKRSAVIKGPQVKAPKKGIKAK